MECVNVTKQNLNAFSHFDGSSIEADGTVTYSYRVKTTVLCDMNLQKFPHDTQVARQDRTAILGGIPPIFRSFSA